jgi:two-component system, OmpR family, sensor histidine kinase ChvG
MGDTPGRRGTRWLRSIRLQAVALAVILLALPGLIFTVLANAEVERRLLILNAVADAGDAIAAGLAPMLHDLRPAELDTLRSELARFATEDRSIKVLLRPTSATTAEAFYFVATAPPISPEQTEGELQQLLRLGILPGLSQGCAARLLRDREASLLDNGAEVLTSVTSVAGAAGCWAVVIATGERHVLGAIEARPYWSRQEVRVAIAIYALMAILVAAIFAGIWTDLLRFRRLALSPTQHAGFARTTGIPELAPLAAAFDSMVQRMKRSADMLRQAAEDNAHAFKGPIGTIRQAIEQPLRQALTRDQALHDSLRTVSGALDRLDGLVQSARYLDGAAAELLEPQLSRVDLSALARAFVRSYGTMNAARQVRLDVQIADGIGVTGQPETLETILETVVDNAVSFSPSGGRVLVRVEPDGDTAIVSVADDGPGVAPDRLDRIFNRYYTHRPTASPHSGPATDAQHFGIGLWLARQYALALGGTISAFNRQPHGLCVTVVLPMAGRRCPDGPGAEIPHEPPPDRVTDRPPRAT